MNISTLLTLSPGTQLVNTTTQQRAYTSAPAHPSRYHGWRIPARTQHGGTTHITPINATDWQVEPQVKPSA